VDALQSLLEDWSEQRSTLRAHGFIGRFYQLFLLHCVKFWFGLAKMTGDSP